MYRLYIDEVGTDSASALAEDRSRYLSLTGVAIELEHVRNYLTPQIDRVKSNFFEYDPDIPVCFHRVDIVNFRDPFHALRNSQVRMKFDDAIIDIVSECNYRVFTILIDKLMADTRTHWKNTHPYHFLMEIMIERYTKFLERVNDIGDIMPEARGKRQDQALTREFLKYRDGGTRYVSSNRIQQAIPSKNLKFRTKKDNISGLQLCDLLAHPSHYCIRHNKRHPFELGDFAQKVATILVESKYDRSTTGGVWGYGAKFVP